MHVLDFFRVRNVSFQVVVGYPKTGTKNPTVTLKVFDSTAQEIDEAFFTVTAPTNLIGKYVIM